MCSQKCSIITAVIGAVLVIVSVVVSFVAIPSIVETIIISEVVLRENTIQFERFEQVPFPLDFSVTVFNITNPNEVLAGEIPVVSEIGPFKYKLYQSRIINETLEDTVKYRRLDNFEFDAEGSYPYTEDDIVTVVNVPYHAIIQIAELQFASLLSVLNLAMDAIFGVNNAPIISVRVGDLFFEGIRMCENPGLVGTIACNLIKDIGQDAQNLVEQPDGSILFSLLAYKNNIPSEDYLVYRGLSNSDQLGEIIEYANRGNFTWWEDFVDGQPGDCNTIKGTDSGIFAPFVNTAASVYAINTDICRSVELRYQYDVDVGGIPAVRYSANEWFLSNEEGCYCLNTTKGINREDGCLLEGAMELFTCVGAMLVLSYPHFLYADARYRNNVIGMSPEEDKHRIYLDLEPRTGTPVQGAKRAQFNIFTRPVTGIPSTQNFRTSLMPIVWVEEGITLPEEYQDELKTKLLLPLTILDIAIPVLITICCLVLVLGVGFLVKNKLAQRSPSTAVLVTENTK